MKFSIYIIFLTIFSSLILHIKSQTRISCYDSFKLSYFAAGLGSGFGKLAPTVRVRGTDLIYTYQQNSFYNGEIRIKPDTIFIGKIRKTSIDSIFYLVKDIKDTLIYTTNIYVMSGAIIDMTIKFESINLTFRMHNANGQTAKEIIEILNSNIPADKWELWYFD